MPEVSPQARGIVTLHAWHDVPLGARIEDHFTAVIEIPKGSPHRVKELERFFLDHKVLENKMVDVEELRGRPHAEDTVREAARLYREKIKR